MIAFNRVMVIDLHTQIGHSSLRLRRQTWLELAIWWWFFWGFFRYVRQRPESTPFYRHFYQLLPELMLCFQLVRYGGRRPREKVTEGAAREGVDHFIWTHLRDRSDIWHWIFLFTISHCHFHAQFLLWSHEHTSFLCYCLKHLAVSHESHALGHD